MQRDAEISIQIIHFSTENKNKNELNVLLKYIKFNSLNVCRKVRNCKGALIYKTIAFVVLDTI